MSTKSIEKNDEFKAAIARNDWDQILELLKKKSYQRKFEIIEAYAELVAEKGLHQVTHAEIAKKCGTSRQVIDHHFPTTESLVTLTYRYVYANFQKVAADGILMRSGVAAQLDGYLGALATWVIEKRSYARFLAQFFALISVDPLYLQLHERNIKMGNDRTVALCLEAMKAKLLPSTSIEVVRRRALIMQSQIAGFVILFSVKPKASITPEIRASFVRACLQTLGFQPSKSLD